MTTSSHPKQSRSRTSRTSLSASNAASHSQSDTRQLETAAHTVAGASFMTFPPPTTNIPAPPPGFVATNGSDYRGLVPKKAELAVVDGATKEIARLADYEQVFFKIAPPKAAVAEVFSAASQWSSLREQAATWDLYCRTQEGLAWTALRGLMAKMRPAYAAVSAADPSVATLNPSLTALFAVTGAISKRSAASRKAGGKKDKAAQAAAQPATPTATTVSAPPPAQAPVAPAVPAAGSTVH